MGILDDAIREHLELKRRRGADSSEVARQEREVLGAEAAAEGGYDAAEPVAYEAPAAEPAAYADDSAGFDDALYDEPEPAAPLAGAPLIEEQAPEPPAAPLTEPVDRAGRPGAEIFPGTGELLAAAAESAEPAAPASAPAPTQASTPAPAPAGADEETAARSGARRLSDEELAAWRRRLSERADRLAAQRPGGAAEQPAAGTDPAPSPRPAPTIPAKPAEEPPAYWSGNAAAPATPAGGAAHTPPPAEEPGVPVDFFDAGDAESAFAPEPAPEPQPDTDHDVLDETPDFLQETPEHDRMWFEQRPPRDFDFG